jgi:peptidoglycan/LPS O-acetylase OafA/YrhL
MFGTYRILLALTVVFLHFTNIAELSGLYAVFGFFVLSGYLMTLIMNESYGYTVNGIFAYAINRFLRIYPIYWFSCVIALLVIVLIAGKISIGGAGFYMPETPREWFQNFALLLKFSTKPQIIQPAWTLTVELFFYLFIGAGLSRNKAITGVWLAASIVYTLYMLTTGATDYARFFTLGAASLPFSIGASMYHWRDNINARLPQLSTAPLLPAILFGIYLANIAVSHNLNVHNLAGFYINIGLCAILLLTLQARRDLPGISRKLDNALGELSYPVYLIHAPLSWFLLYVCKLTGIPISGPSLLAFFTFVIPTVVIAWLMTVSIEKPIELARSRIKQSI